MTEVTRRFDLLDWLKPWRLWREYLAFLDSTMARFWDVGTVPLSRVLERLEEAGVGRLLGENDLARHGLNFTDNRYGDAVFLVEPGCLLSPSFMEMPFVPFASTEIKGMHGYTPEEPSTRGLFLYRGPTPLPYEPTRVTDVAGVIEQLLGLPAQAGSYHA